MKTIGEKLYYFRKKIGMTQKELADASNTSQNLISDIELGKVKNPQKQTKIRIANALKVPVEYLSDEKNEGNTMAKEPKSEYILPDQTSQGFREFLNDEDIKILINPTEEEIEWLQKSVVFMPEDKPTKQTYIDLLLTYRKLKKK